ncbi:hypothetical protein ABT040_40045 [Streptomyces sp. NPDC002688]|uniref:hypothetical protein n=1 Tax=Streptomyces sp. NPDC002688 TaxID=3154423 RepID=UPI00331EBC65
MTIADLVRLGPDGREAVRTALQELEAHGYLLRERLRRSDGTLGEIIYCITDRPAAADLEMVEADVVSTASEAGSNSLLGAGIRRGVMAADQFTQIANALFRDPHLSYKAKGLFGLLSTRRDGWRMTVADIARRARDGDAAVKSGLNELEKRGFLIRERERDLDGTLGAVAYFITDLPSLQNPRSQPESGFPPVDRPTLADRSTKNTNQQNTNPLPPCDRAPAARTETGTDPGTIPSATPAPATDEMHPGIRLLLDIAGTRPELLLTGKTLTDQGRVLTAMMDTGWSPEQLRHIITERPLPTPVRTTVGAIIAARLRAAQAYPPPATAPDHHGDSWLDKPLPSENRERSATASSARTVTEALTYRALVECAGCGVPGTPPGEDLCPACLGWPLCRTCPGPTPRRARPGGNGCSMTCASALADPSGGGNP